MRVVLRLLVVFSLVFLVSYSFSFGVKDLTVSDRLLVKSGGKTLNSVRSVKLLDKSVRDFSFTGIKGSLFSRGFSGFWDLSFLSRGLVKSSVLFFDDFVDGKLVGGSRLVFLPDNRVVRSSGELPIWFVDLNPLHVVEFKPGVLYLRYVLHSSNEELNVDSFRVVFYFPDGSVQYFVPIVSDINDIPADLLPFPSSYGYNYDLELFVDVSSWPEADLGDSFNYFDDPPNTNYYSVKVYVENLKGDSGFVWSPYYLFYLLDLRKMSCVPVVVNADRSLAVDFYFLASGFGSNNPDGYTLQDFVEYTRIFSSREPIWVTDLYGRPAYPGSLSWFTPFNEFVDSVNFYRIESEYNLYPDAIIEYELGGGHKVREKLHQLLVSSPDKVPMQNIVERVCNVGLGLHDQIIMPYVGVGGAYASFDGASWLSFDGANGGIGSQMTYMSTIHELGHAFGHLADEYVYNETAVSDYPSMWPNADVIGCPKWCSGEINTEAPCYPIFSQYWQCIQPYLSYSVPGREEALKNCYWTYERIMEEQFNSYLDYCDIGKDCLVVDGNTLGCYWFSGGITGFREMHSTIMHSSSKTYFSPFSVRHLRRLFDEVATKHKRPF